MDQNNVTKSINIADLVEKFPNAAKILMDEGIGCLGCAIAHQETLEQGLSAHGKSADEVDRIVAAINRAIAKETNID